MSCFNAINVHHRMNNNWKFDSTQNANSLAKTATIIDLCHYIIISQFDALKNHFNSTTELNQTVIKVTDFNLFIFFDYYTFD